MSLDQDWTTLRALAHKTIKQLEKQNVTHAEAFFTSNQTTEVIIRNSEIHTQNRIVDSGVGFRVAVLGNRIGFACTNMLNEKAFTETGEKALQIARVSSELPSFALPGSREAPNVKGMFDSRVAEMTVEAAVEMAERAIDAAEGFDKRVVAKDGRIFFQHGLRGIINTLGADLEEKETKTMVYLGGSGEQNDEVTGSCYDFSFSRTPDLKPETIGENVAKMVVGLFNPQQLKSFQGTVVFRPEAVSYQLAEVLIDTLRGENAATGRSPWTHKIGQEVTSQNLTVIDDAVLEKGFASRNFDDEGCISQRTMLIDNGQLESFLHNATSANALKAKNTGNASRSTGDFDMVRMIIGQGYRTQPKIHPSNLIIQAGSKTQEELVSEVEKGILVESMAGFPQPGSGIISAQLSRAYFIQNGEIQHPIKGGMVSGIAFDWFKQISDIGNDSKQFQNSVVPSLRMEDVKIVGA